MNTNASTATLPDLFPFDGLDAVMAHAALLHQALAPKVDPRAETVRIVYSRKAG